MTHKFFGFIIFFLYLFIFMYVWRYEPGGRRKNTGTESKAREEGFLWLAPWLIIM